MMTLPEYTLLALGIYEDTGSMTYGTTTARDLQAVTWLVEQGAELDTVRRFLMTPLNEEQEALLEQLLINNSASSHQLTLTLDGSGRGFAASSL